MTRSRRLFLVTVVVAVVIAVALALYSREVQTPGPRLVDNVTGLVVGPGWGGDFTLAGPEGRPVSLEQFRGHPVLLYFGYTTCPDVCPTALGVLKQATKRLAELKLTAQVLFVTIDPERDTGEALQSYVHFFGPDFIGLTGSPAEIADVARRYNVMYAKEDKGSAAGYLMAHTDYIYLLGIGGRIRGLYNSATPAERIVAGVQAIAR